MSIATPTALEAIPKILEKQRAFFRKGTTRDIDFRKKQLEKLKAVLQNNEEALYEAVFKDLHKSQTEVYATELGLVYNEIDEALHKLERWAAPKRKRTPLFHFKASSRLHSEPYGQTLIIAPWNYPILLLLSPMVGAISAGNTLMLKPSELAPFTSAAITELLRQTFAEDYIGVVEGGVPESQALLALKFDYIFFTGSTQVGRIVYQAAAKHLTPVTLELGGKSPCIVDSQIPLQLTARRIVWGKFVNAGQTCIAPDYILVHESKRDALVEAMREEITNFYGDNPQESPDFCRIVNDKHFERLNAYLQDGLPIVGGLADADDQYIAPTLLLDVAPDAAVMQEEIFGPILPILTYKNLQEAIDFVNARPKPLALYVFSKKEAFTERVLAQTSSGGVTINDTLLHITSPELPFGGVGESGIGGYHGQASFDTFSHQRSVLHRSFLIDVPLRYPPYKVNLNLLKKALKWTMR